MSRKLCIDTLAFARKLEEAGAEKEKAENLVMAIMRTIDEAIITFEPQGEVTEKKLELRIDRVHNELKVGIDKICNELKLGSYKLYDELKRQGVR